MSWFSRWLRLHHVPEKINSSMRTTKNTSNLKELWLDPSSAYILLVMQREDGEYSIRDPQKGGESVFVSRKLSEIHEFLCEDEFLQADISDALYWTETHPSQ